MSVLIFPFLYLILTWSALASPKSEPKNPAHKIQTLDTSLAHKFYLDGDFDASIELLKSSLQQGGTHTHAESIFVFKHLGVMYTANYETREEGKRNMMKLLEVEPTAKIMDMYASDMIYMIFKNIQDEYEISKAKLNHTEKMKMENIDSNKLANTKAAKQSAPEKTKNYQWIPWTIAAIVITGGGIFAYSSYFSDLPSKKENVIP